MRRVDCEVNAPVVVTLTSERASHDFPAVVISNTDPDCAVVRIGNADYLIPYGDINGTAAHHRRAVAHVLTEYGHALPADVHDCEQFLNRIVRAARGERR